jgi:hypothetical protein
MEFLVMGREDLNLNLIGPRHAILSESCQKLIDYEFSVIQLSQECHRFRQEFENKVP